MRRYWMRRNRKRTSKRASILACALAAWLCAAMQPDPARAADPAGAAPSPGAPSAASDSPAAALPDPQPWQFSMASYAWLMGVTGNIGVRGQQVDTNASFIDLVQKSNTLFGLMGYFEADKGPAGVYLDLVYTKLNFSASQTAYRNPLPALRISANAYAAASYQLFIAEMGGVYTLANWRRSETSFTAVDGLLAFRYWNNQLTASFDADINFDVGRRFRFDRSGGLAIASSDVIQWVDPVVGFRVRHQIDSHQEFSMRGDIGGFGLGSQFSWQALAVYRYGWRLEGGQTLSALLGFRALSVAYSRGSGDDTTAINELLYGPIIGVSLRF